MLYSYYRPDGALDLNAHLRQMDYVLEHGADGVTLLGLASEGAMLTAGERLACIRATAERLPPDRHLIVTIRADDEETLFAEAILSIRDDVTFIFQVGVDTASVLEQSRRIRDQQPQIRNGLQLAPGLIEGATATLDLLNSGHIDIDVVKAEYDSLTLGADMEQLSKKPALLVGKHGVNLIDYLRVGAVGVIPGTEMTAPLAALWRSHRAGRMDDVLAAYKDYAPYVDFAMQDLATVLAVGRIVTGNALGIEVGRARDVGTLDARSTSAIALWERYWIDTLSTAA